MRAIRVHAHGGPEAPRFEEIPDPVPGAGQALVRIEAVGVVRRGGQAVPRSGRSLPGKLRESAG